MFIMDNFVFWEPSQGFLQQHFCLMALQQCDDDPFPAGLINVDGAHRLSSSAVLREYTCHEGSALVFQVADLPVDFRPSTTVLLWGQ